MNVDPVTARWSEALFNAARRAGALPEVERDVRHLAKALAPASVQVFLYGSRVDPAEKREKLERLASSLHPLVLSFVRLALDRRREEILRDLPRAFRGLMLRSRGAVEGRVESPRPLGEPELASLARSLSVRLGKEVLLENHSNPELIAGVRVFVGGRMIDQTVHGRMQRLRRRLLEARLPSVG